MVDSSKIGSTFRIWAGAGESLNPGEFKGALDKADINSDGKLSRSEFNAVASGLGLSSAEAENFFNKARGSDSEVSISGLITAAEAFNAADGKWTRDEFTTVVTSLTTPDQRSAFMDIAGEDAIIDRGEMEAAVSEADTNGDNAISAEEFGKVSETLGVGSSGSAAVASAFKDIAGEASSAKFDEVLSYFTAFSDKDGSYTEAAFNSLVQNLSGGSTGSTGSGSTGGSTGSTGSGSTGGSTGSTGSGSTGGSTGSTGSGSTGGSTGSTGSGSTGGSTGSTGSGSTGGSTGSTGSGSTGGSTGSTGAGSTGGSTGSTGSGSTGGSTGSTAAKISISKEAFEFLTGTDLLLQRDELAAVFNKVDAGQDKKLTIEEFRSAAIRAGVSPTRDDNIDAVFRLIADGETTISTNQAIAYFSALNGPDNDWSQSEFESVLTRLSNGPDAPATTNTSPATSTSSTTSSTSTSSTTSSTSTSSTTSTASTTPATSTTSTTSTASTTPATSTTSTASTTPTTSTTSTTSTASTTPSTSLGGNTSSTTKNAGFDRVAGANGQIERSELRAVVAAADRDRNNELSRSEFKALAYELGVPAKNNADINEIFGIIAKGESNKITIQQALAYFDQFKGADNKWSEAEFSKIVTRLSEGAPSVFSSLATNGVIKTAALAAQFTRVDTNKDGQLDKSEFEQLAANLGVDALKGAKFSAVAGNNNKISAAELLGYANGFGTTTNGVVTWSEAQFNAVVSDLTKKGG